MKKIELKTGIELIANERKRQIEIEGYTTKHDKQYENEELANAAACYAMSIRHRTKYQSLNVETKRWFPRWFPWHDKHWKPTPEDRVRELIKAGALISAEIDRLNNIEDKEIIDCKLESKAPEMLALLQEFLQMVSDYDMRPEDEVFEFADKVSKLIEETEL